MKKKNIIFCKIHLQKNYFFMHDRDRSLSSTSGIAEDFWKATFGAFRKAGGFSLIKYFYFV